METDLSFITEVKCTKEGPWLKADMLLTGGYGWMYMLQSADYVRQADLHAMNLAVVPGLGAQEKDCTPLLSAGDSLAKGELKDAEGSALLLSGSSISMRCLMRIVWVNQTRLLRIFVNRDATEDELRLYAARLICRTFTADAGTAEPPEKKETVPVSQPAEKPETAPVPQPAEKPETVPASWPAERLETVSAPQPAETWGEAPAPAPEAKKRPAINGPRVLDMRSKISAGWRQADFLLTDANEWQYILSSADYLRQTDLIVDRVLVTPASRMTEKDCQEALTKSGGSFLDSTLTETECDSLTLIGRSRYLRLPVRITWYNRERKLRIAAQGGVENYLRRYADLLLTRDFIPADNSAPAQTPTVSAGPWVTPVPAQHPTGIRRPEGRGTAVMGFGIGTCWLLGGCAIAFALEDASARIMGPLMAAMGVLALVLSARSYLKNGGTWKNILRGYAKALAVIAGYVVFMEVVISQSSSPGGFSLQVTLVSAAVLAGCVAVLKLVKKQKRKDTEA